MTRRVLLCVALAACDDGGSDEPPDAGVPFDNGSTTSTIEVIGDPRFTIVSWRHYSTPMGTTPVAEEWEEAITPLWPGHRQHPFVNSIGPFVPHQPPYDLENADALLAAGYDDGDLFREADWTAPLGLTLSGLIIPDADAPMGSTPDYELGPVISNVDWPMTVDADLFKDGVLVDPDFDSEYPNIGDLTPDNQSAPDGFSHMPLNFGESTVFIAGTPGEYEYVVTVMDNAGNGIRSRIPFTIR